MRGKYADTFIFFLQNDKFLYSVSSWSRNGIIIISI